MLSILVFAAALAAPSAPPLASKTDPAAAARCRGGEVTNAAWKRERGPQQPRAQRLGELPRARVERTVMRKVDGCVVPVIIRYEGEGVRPSKAGARRVD